MRYSEKALDLLTIRTYPRIGAAWIHKNLPKIDDLKSIFNILETHEHEFLKKRDRIRQTIDQLQSSIDGIVALGDSDFPSLRGTDHPEADKPFAIFYKGNLNLLRKENLNIAVIGVLNPDEKTEITERIVTTEILKHNATIVSGLALGCDSIAHRTALENNGKTIAILPSPLNSVLPKENIELAEQIVENGGLLISEYYEAPKSRFEMVNRYVVRDRLQAIFSDAIILTASYAPNNLGNDCGSRHAMEKAKRYGIRRGVIYNETKHANNPMYDLNRQILAADNSVIRIESSRLSDLIESLVKREPSSTESNQQLTLGV